MFADDTGFSGTDDDSLGNIPGYGHLHGTDLPVHACVSELFPEAVADCGRVRYSGGNDELCQ